MVLRLVECNNKDFAKRIVPQVMSSMCLRFLDSRATAFDKYLKFKLGLNTNVCDLTKYICNTMQAVQDKRDYVIHVNYALSYENKYKLDQLARLLEYGNSEIGGLRIFSKLANYILAYRSTLESTYEIGKGVI